MKPFPNGCQTPRKGKPVIRFVVVCRHSSLCIYNPIQSQPSTINLYCLVCGSPLLCSGDNHFPKKKMLGGGGFVCSEFNLQCLRMCTFLGLLSSVMRFFIDLLFILFGSDVVRFAVNHDHFFSNLRLFHFVSDLYFPSDSFAFKFHLFSFYLWHIYLDPLLDIKLLIFV